MDIRTSNPTIEIIGETTRVVYAEIQSGCAYCGGVTTHVRVTGLEGDHEAIAFLCGRHAKGEREHCQRSGTPTKTTGNNAA